MFSDYFFFRVDTHYVKDEITPLFSLKISTISFPLSLHKLFTSSCFPMLACLCLSIMLGTFRCLMIWGYMLTYKSLALKNWLECLYTYMWVYMCLWHDYRFNYKVFLLGCLIGDLNMYGYFFLWWLRFSRKNPFPVWVG